MNKLRKALVVGVMAITVLSVSMLSVPFQVGAAAQAGDLIKMDGLSSIYYLGADGKRYVFPNEATYFSWYSDFSGVVTIPQSELETYPLGANVTMRPGTKLVKITTDPKVYAVEPDGKLVHVPSEATAIALFGADWAKRVVDLSDAFFTNYSVTGNQVSATAYPTGSLVKFGGADVYYINESGAARKVANESAFLANRFKWSDVITSTLTMPALGTDIAGAEATLTDTSSGAGGTAGAGSGLTVALSSQTPTSATYIRDTGAVVAQAAAEFTKINFTAASDGDVTVNTLKLTRSGISADTDLGVIYLYDGNTMIAEHTSFSSKVITFSNSAGLFTVSKGTTKTISVRADIAAANATVSGIVLGVNAASDVTTNGATVSGAFPINGNQMSVGTVTDLGYMNLASYDTNPSTIEPGKTNEEIWRFNATANDQDMLIEKIKMTVVGTVSTSDLANFKLEVGGVQVGSTVANMNASKEVIFDLSSASYKITSGQTKTIVVKADVVNGSGRTFRLTIRKVGDISVKDYSYGISVKPLVDGAAFSLMEPTSAPADTTVDNGTITVGVATDSPTGNIAAGATGVTLAKFTYKANGEDVKLNQVTVDVQLEDQDLSSLKNGKLYFNGTQVGSTDTEVTDEADVLYEMTQVIAAGNTAVIEYKADIIVGTSTTAIAAGQTVVVSLISDTSGAATGQSSLSDVDTAAATGKTLTVRTGALTGAINSALSSYTTTNPLGVAGATNAKVGSFVLTAGAGEGVTVSQVVVGDKAAGDEFGVSFQNLTLKSGSTQLATAQGTLSITDGADYTFNMSPALKIAAGQQVVIDCYADIKSSGTEYSSAGVGLEFTGASATGDLTSSDASYSTDFDLQQLVISANGGLTIAIDSTTPDAAQIAMGSTDTTLAVLKFTASSSEDINISRIKLKNTGNAGTSLSNIKLYDGLTQVGATINSFDAASNGYAEFNLASNWVITKNTTKTLTVKASVNIYPNATSAGTEIVGIAAAGDVDTYGASSGANITETVTSAAGNTFTVVRTKITVAKASDSPAGSAGKSATHTIAIFSVTNSSNPDNQEAKITDLATRIAFGTGDWATTTVKVYKDSVTSANLLGQASIANTASNGDVAFEGWTTGGDSNPAANSLKDATIGAGATIKLYVVVDTTAAPDDSSITASLNAGDVKWYDGVFTAGTASTTVDSLPVTGGTLTF